MRGLNLTKPARPVYDYFNIYHGPSYYHVPSETYSYRRCSGSANGVPQRYVCDVAERPAVDTTDTPVDIPVIDLSKLLKGDEDQFHMEMSKLTVACQDWGFFQVINHGIDVETQSNMEKSVADFFLQPLQEKQKYPYGQAFVLSEDEKLDWCNMLALAYEPHHMRRLTLWPKNPPTFGENFEN